MFILVGGGAEGSDQIVTRIINTYFGLQNNPVHNIGITTGSSNRATACIFSGEKATKPTDATNA